MVQIRNRNRQISDGIDISKSFLIKVSLGISAVHLVLISLMAYAYLHEWLEIKMQYEPRIGANNQDLPQDQSKND